MAAKTPIRTVYDGDTATGLAEFQDGEFVAVEHGGTGAATHTATSILLGNGTSAIASSTIQISSNTISSSDASTITIGDNLNVSGNIVATGNITANGDITIGDSASDTVTITADVSSNLIPSADSTYALGASDSAWSNIYVDTVTLGGTAITSTAAELNLLDGVTATTAEINYLDGVTSNIQTQIDNIDVSLTLAADSGTNDSFTTGSTLTFTGDTGITTTVSDDTITIDLDDTAVTAGSYGSATAIPVLTVDQQGRITSASTSSITTSLTVGADSGTDDTVALATDTLNISGGTGVATTVSNNDISIAIGQAVSTSSDVTFNSVTADVTGTVSSISNHDTDDLSEGSTNQYFTTARARSSLSVSGDVAYNSSTGVISFSETYSSAAELLTAIKTVDGSGSGLDADTLDGYSSSEFLTTTSVSPTSIASTSSTAYNTSDYGNLTNDTGTAGFVNEPIRATAYQDLALPGTTVTVDWGDLS